MAHRLKYELRWVCPLRWVFIVAFSSHLLLKPKYFHLDKNQSMVKIKKPSITLEYHFFPVVYFWSIHFGVLKAQMSIVSSCSPFNQLLQHSSISFQAIYFHQTFVAFFPPVQTQKQSSQIEFDSKYKQTDLSRSDVTANIVPFAWCWLCFDFELWTLNIVHTFWRTDICSRLSPSGCNHGICSAVYYLSLCDMKFNVNLMCQRF